MWKCSCGIQSEGAITPQVVAQIGVCRVVGLGKGPDKYQIKAMIETYNQKVDFVDLKRPDEIMEML